MSRCDTVARACGCAVTAAVAGEPAAAAGYDEISVLTTMAAAMGAGLAAAAGVTADAKSPPAVALSLL